MARTLGATTEDRVARSHLAPVAFVRLRTYTDRAGDTIDRTFYFSTGPGVRYEWSVAEGETNHDPVIQSLGALEVAIPHLPSGDPADIPEKVLELQLANVDFEGSRLAAVLRGHTLENARVDVAQVLLAGPSSAPFLDVTSEEAVVWYRGRVRRVGPISTESITLTCVTEFPDLTWLVATDTEEVDPRDTGRRYPLPYGHAKRVPAIGRIVGWVTTLAEAIENTASTTLAVTDTAGFEDAGSAYIGGEKVTWTGKTATTLTGVTRGASGTALAFHTAGEAIIEVTEGATFTVAGVEVSAIDDLYVRNPFNDEIVRITGSYTKTVDDAVTDTATTATATFTAGELEAQVVAMSQSAEASDIAGASSWSVEQHPDAQYCDSQLTTNAAIYRRYAPIDGTAESSRTNRGSAEVTDGNWYSFGFSSKPPFSRIQSQQLKAYVQRTAGSGDLIIKSSSLASGSGTTTYVSGTDWTASTDGVITLTTTQGESGATDHRWWFESPSGSTWQLFEVWRNLNTNEIGTGYTLGASISTGTWEVRDRDNGSNISTDSSGYTNDGDYTTGRSWESDVDYAHRGVLSGGWEDALYVIEVTPGRGSTQTAAQDLRSIWYEPATINHCDAMNSQRGDGVSAVDTFLRGDTDSDGDAQGGLFDMQASGYSDTWATGSASKLTFWVDGATAAGAGHSVLEFQCRTTLTTDRLVEVDVYKLTDDGPATQSVQVKAANVGFGWEVFSDTSGPEAPSTSPVYKAGTGNLIESPPDVLRHVIEEGGHSIETNSYDDLYDTMAAAPLPKEAALAATLNGAINDVVTTLTVNEDLDDPLWPSEGIVLIDSELIHHQTRNATQLMSLDRGWNGTTPASHSDAADIDEYDGDPNEVVGALRFSMDATQTTMLVNVRAGSQLPDAGEIAIESEELSYDGKTESAGWWTLQNLVRGINGTSGASHLDETPWLLTPLVLPVVFAGDLRPKGLTAREVLSGVAFECGANLVPAETSTGTEWKMLAPDADGDFPASSVTLTEWEPGGFVELGRDVDEDLYTRSVYLYDVDLSAGPGDEAFRGALRASAVSAEHDLTSPTAAEIAAVELTLGRLDAAGPTPFYLLRDGSQTGFIAGRDLTDRLRLPPLYGIGGVPWWQAYTIEVGDIVTATPPWETSSRKLRVIGYTKRFSDELVDLVLVEVT